ncbi:MAG: NAD(+) synthase [Lachnospiraceae bacterium]|nr:NAD(+) synthase [Lachnospiraceae bacterium]
MKDGFIKIAAVTPNVKVADVAYNVGEIIRLYQKAVNDGARIVVFPKLCITGASLGDLCTQNAILKAAREGLRKIAEATRGYDAIAFVSLPHEDSGKPVTVVLQNGVVLARVQKPGSFLMDVSVSGTDLSFSVGLCYRSGADVIVRPAAEYDLVCADRMRTQEALCGSRKNRCVFVEANAGEGESTTDFVYAGHNIVAQCGKLLAESGSFTNGILYATVDVDLVHCARRVNKLNEDLTKKQLAVSDKITAELKCTGTVLTGLVRKSPFIVDSDNEMRRRMAHIFMLQTMGLKKRLTHCNAATAVIGISGGLDSTLALFVTVRAFDLMGKDRKDIIAVTMPCFGTSDRTHQNARTMMELLGVTLKEIPIGNAVTQHFRDIGHDENVRNAAYENAQARERTQILMDLANDSNGLMVGTGDLSELALGWATYGGDHISMYAVNADVPKTLMRRIVLYLAELVEAGDFDKRDQTDRDALAGTLRDVVSTPVSPELLPAQDNVIAQKTEDIVGPYELHDFFLFYMLRYGFMPHKIYRMAAVAFKDEYDAETVRKWMEVFYRRFFAQQFKRSCMPDGPAVGSVGLSPRGTFHMPSDAMATVWLSDLEKMI